LPLFGRLRRAPADRNLSVAGHAGRDVLQREARQVEVQDLTVRIVNREVGRFRASRRGQGHRGRAAQTDRAQGGIDQQRARPDEAIRASTIDRQDAESGQGGEIAAAALDQNLALAQALVGRDAQAQARVAHQGHAGGLEFGEDLAAGQVDRHRHTGDVYELFESIALVKHLPALQREGRGSCARASKQIAIADTAVGHFEQLLGDATELRRQDLTGALVQGAVHGLDQVGAGLGHQAADVQ
jgi:hypothetical protein